MKLTLLTLVILLGMVSADLPPPERSYKILMLVPVSTKSIKILCISLAEALAERGHKIVMLSNHPPFSKHPNIEEIDHGLKDFNVNNINLFESKKDPMASFFYYGEISPAMARKIYNIPEVKNLYEKRKTFDLIMVDHFGTEFIFPFLHEMTYITMSCFGMDPTHSAIFGNLQNPAYAPGIMEQYPNPMSLVNRLLNMWQHVWVPVCWRQMIIPKVQQEISAIFPDLPHLLDIERNSSLMLMNSHFSMDTTMPLLPSQVEMGTIHCRPAQLLPKDLESWIAGAGPEGVVYFSLGTYARGNSMPVMYRNMFIEAFKKLKQRVIWKYEEALAGVSDNVLIQEWLPQQDILGHPNVKVFITHGGLLSTQESLYHAKPVVALPISGDQPKNAKKMQREGLGVYLAWEELTVDIILDAIRGVIADPKYQQNTEAISRVLRDQPQSPKDRVVYWTEYVIRHQGAPRLRSPAAKLSWVEFLMLDVLLVIHVVLYVAYALICRIFRAIYKRASPSLHTDKKRV